MESIATKADKKAKDQRPDLMFSHIQVLPMDRPNNPGPAFESWDRRLGARAFHQCFPLIGELKRPPSRRLHGDPHSEKLENKLLCALTDLTTYCAMHCDGDDHSQEVICVRGAGCWWQWAVIRRQDAVRCADIEDLSEHDPTLVAARGRLERRFERRPTRYLGQPASDQEWMVLRDRLLQILNRHAAHYPPPPQ